MSETKTENELVFIDFETVKKSVGENSALPVYREIAQIAGGDPNPNHAGGMDLGGLSAKDKAKIVALLKAKK